MAPIGPAAKDGGDSGDAAARRRDHLARIPSGAPGVAWSLDVRIVNQAIHSGEPDVQLCANPLRTDWNRGTVLTVSCSVETVAGNVACSIGYRRPSREACQDEDRRRVCLTKWARPRQ